MSPAWKNSATVPVLRLLEESDLALSATSIQYNLDQQLERPPSKSTVYRALSGALDAGLVYQPQGSLYVIDDAGREYIDGNLSEDNIDA
jgi:predicted transcriptional regulator